jgi:hypothetical protein
VWTVAPGAPQPSEAARRLAVAAPANVVDGHVAMIIEKNGSFDVLLRFTDLQQGQTSHVFRVAVTNTSSSCASTHAPSLLALVALLAAVRRARRLVRSRACLGPAR